MAFVVFSACASRPIPPPCNPALALVNAAAWMQTAVEYRASALQSYAAARKALDAALATSSDKPPAIILDLDETALNNGEYETRMIRAGKTYDAEEWKRWVSESAARAVPGAAEFLTYAHSRGVTPFYITNRKPEEEPATRRNLETLGFPLDPTVKTLLMRDASNDKSAQRDLIASQYRVLLVLGDDLNDFVNAAGKNLDQRAALFRENADKWGTSWFILPNPLYGSWESAVAGKGTDCEKMQRKIEALKP